MFQKYIPIIFSSIMAIWICTDCLEACVINKDSTNKLRYLTNIHKPIQLNALYKSMRENFEIKEYKSLKHLWNLDPEVFDLSELENWINYVDATDSDNFQNEIDRIPLVKSLLKKEQLDSVRQKFIYGTLLRYAYHKTKVMDLGFYIDKYSPVKDIHNNIYLLEYGTTNNIKTRIDNEEITGRGNHYRIPISDSVEIISYQRPYGYNIYNSAQIYKERDTLINVLSL